MVACLWQRRSLEQSLAIGHISLRLFPFKILKMPSRANLKFADLLVIYSQGSLRLRLRFELRFHTHSERIADLLVIYSQRRVEVPFEVSMRTSNGTSTLQICLLFTVSGVLRFRLRFQ